MQITSSAAGLYPVLVPTTRKPAVAANANDTLSNGIDRSSVQAIEVSDQQARHRAEETRQEILPAVDSLQTRLNIEGSNVAGLTRQLTREFQTGSEESAAQTSIQSLGERAVSNYVDVATQEHRDELISLLGIDVFA